MVSRAVHFVSALLDGAGGIGVEGQIAPAARLILVVGLAADHGPVVPAQRQGGQVEPVAAGPAGPLQIGPDAAVGRHPPATATLP